MYSIPIKQKGKPFWNNNIGFSHDASCTVPELKMYSWNGEYQWQSRLIFQWTTQHCQFSELVESNFQVERNPLSILTDMFYFPPSCYVWHQQGFCVILCGFHYHLHLDLHPHKKQICYKENFANPSILEAIHRKPRCCNRVPKHYITISSGLR